MVLRISLAFLCLWMSRVHADLFVAEIDERTFLKENITVIHDCYLSYSLCGQIFIKAHRRSPGVFEEARCIDCSVLQRSRGASEDSYKTVISIFIPKTYTCAPDYWNKDPVFIHSSELSIFLIQTRFTKSRNKRLLGQSQHLMKDRITYDIFIPPPYSRNACLSFTSGCTSFYHKMAHWAYPSQQIPRSPLVQVPFALTTSVFVSLGKMGQYLFFPDNTKNEYFSRYLLSNSKKFTFSLWIYLYSDCASRSCNILSFVNDTDETFLSPVVHLKDNGRLHIQSKERHSGLDAAFITGFQVPTRAWCHFVFSIDSRQWSSTLFSHDGQVLASSIDIQFQKEIHINLNSGFAVIGGSQIYTGFEGYVTDVYLYPGELVEHGRVHRSQTVRSYEALRITPEQRMDLCFPVAEELDYYLLILKNQFIEEQHAYSSKKYQLAQRIPSVPHCQPRGVDLGRPKLFLYMRKLISNNSLVSEKLRKGATITLNSVKNASMSISEHLFERSMTHIKKNGLRMGSLVARYMEESSCLGHAEATYVLATMYFYGIGPVKINATKAYELLLWNVLRSNHRLSLLALGNMHKFHLVPSMDALSVVFYKSVADLTVTDVHNLDKEDMFNDAIRLTNEAEIKEHTDENDDLFYWIKHQAEAGIPWAKQRLGRMFYWGSQGIQRNFNQAANYLRMAAQGPDAQPENHFDYGLFLVKDVDKKENVREGTAQLEKASEKDPRALTVLGWLAEVHNKDYQLAYTYYQKAHKLGNPDATFNLGVYEHSGRLNNQQMNKRSAFHLFQKAAVRNQLNAGAMYSHYQMTGIEGFLPRNISMATNWARHVGEQSPRVGFHLGEGVRAYRKKKMGLSIFYYLLAAFTGLELANFNAAVLCEEHEPLVKKYVQKECIWYHYNLSIQREEHQIHAYSLIKMGDRSWYGCGDGVRNIRAAAAFYLMAALKNEPQAYFNLAFIIETGEVDIAPMLVGKIIPHPSHSESLAPDEWTYGVITRLYRRCEELSEENTYLPCQLASRRLAVVRFWRMTKIKIQMIAAMTLTALIVYKFTKLMTRRHGSEDTSNDANGP